MSQQQPSSSKHTFTLLLFSCAIPCLITTACIILQEMGLITIAQKTYLIPEGFEGYIWIIYEQPNGQNPGPAFNEIYLMPDDGIYLANKSLSRRYHQSKFWYVDQNGNKLVEIKDIYTCTNLSQYNPNMPIICGGNSYGMLEGRDMPPNQQFNVFLPGNTTWDANNNFQDQIHQVIIPLLFPETAE